MDRFATELPTTHYPRVAVGCGRTHAECCSSVKPSEARRGSSGAAAMPGKRESAEYAATATEARVKLYKEVEWDGEGWDSGVWCGVVRVKLYKEVEWNGKGMDGMG